MNDPARLHTTQVNLSGLLEVLGSNLYSTPIVAVRELVQNAHDSCNRRRLEATGPFEPEIRVGCSAAENILWVEDTGAGLTRDEVVEYLATVGAGYTRLLREEKGDSTLIGAFGLGFLTAYVIGRRVEVWTTSHRDPDGGVHFASDTGQTYVLEDTAPRPIGTRVEIHLRDEYEDLSDRPLLEDILRHYCALLPLPVYLGEDRLRINDIPPPWRVEKPDEPEVRKRKQRLAFAQLFETYFEPLCALPINQVRPGEGRGMVWIHDSSTYGNADNRRLAVYVRGMQVTPNERDLLPSWAGFVGGVYECDDLTPTASRESLQKNLVYELAESQIARELTRQLALLAHDEPEIWRSVLRRHNEALIGAAISDEALFDLLGDQLRVSTSEGDLTLPQVLERSGGAVHLSLSEDGGAEEVVSRTMGIPIVNGFRYGVVPFCTMYADINDLKLVGLGTESGNRDLFPPAELDAEAMARLKSWFANDDRRIVTSRFAPDFLPLLVLRDHEAELKAFFESDDADRRIASGALALARAYTQNIDDRPPLTVIVNLDAAVIQRLLAADPDRTEPAASLLRHLADLLTSRHAAQGGVDMARVVKDFSETVSALLG